MTPYSQIAEAIIQKQILVLGKPIAVERARRVSGLLIDDDGKVRDFPSDGTAALETLVNQYFELLGPAGISFSRDAALPIITENPGIALPRALIQAV